MSDKHVNKVSIGDEDLIDLTEDTVSPSNLANGITAHDASGAPIVGTGRLLDGVIPISDGGTGATTAADARKNLGINAANVVDNQTIAPSSVSATGEVKGSTVSDSVGSLADLRNSVSPMHPYIDSRTGNLVFAINLSGQFLAFTVAKDGKLHVDYRDASEN